jgi:nucleoside-diphosphate-sugar epimerase
MRILITGATGFIGKSFLERNINKKFMVISRRNKPNKLKINWVKSDISNIKKKIKIIKKFNPNILIHLAWQGIPLLNKKNSLINLKKHKIFFKILLKFIKFDKIIVSGSCFEYDSSQEKIYEDSKLSRSHFAKAKKNLYNYLLRQQVKKNFKLIWLVIFYVYGSNQRKESLIPSLIMKFNKNKEVFLNSPNEKKDFIYINDVTSALEKAVSTDANGIFNLGSGKPYSPLYIARFLKKKINSVSVINFNKELNHRNKKKFYASINKAKKHFRWEPKFSLKLGLVNTLKKFC